MLELSWALQQMHVDLHPALSTCPEVVLPALSLLLSALRLLLHLWCLWPHLQKGYRVIIHPSLQRGRNVQSPFRGRETYIRINICTSIHIFYIYIHTYLHTKHLVLQHLFCIKIESHNYRGVFLCVCVCISEATINPVWFWSHISQDTNHHHPFVFCFHALYEEECSEFPNSFHKLFRTEHVKLEKIKANKQSISAGDVALRVKAEGLCSLFWPCLGSD